MPSKDWDSQVDWLTWALTNLDANTTPGVLQIAAGFNTGTGLSPPYECAAWERYSRLSLEGSLPEGTNIFVRFRTGATQLLCEAAAWSDYINGFDESGLMLFDLRVHILNAGIVPGDWIQFEVTLLGE